jgi:nitrogen fixation/metabolism regulation signal transduction histidine kinase
MATEERPRYVALLAALNAPDWAGVLNGVGAAETWLREATPGDPRIDEVVSRLVSLANHSKWEIRRAVANVAAQALHPSFEGALAKLATDDNARVRQAAEHAALRRRDWQNASTLGKQHEDRINATLDDIEARFGLRARDAVKRASEQIANTFARELYHEVIKLLTPLAMSADRLVTQLSTETVTRAEVAIEAERIGSRVSHLRAVLEGMRAYTEHPRLTFARESLKDIIEEAASLVREAASRNGPQPPIDVQADPTVAAEVSRARLLQAVTNVLANAVESYHGLSTLEPIVVRAEAGEGWVAISIRDSGCGMSKEDLRDAAVLFATNKETGTGFGLPLAIKIVETEHRGRLSLESIRGRGTVVRVVIPSQRQGEPG